MKAVLITTEYRGVFFGWTEDYRGETVTLKNCRNCIYWPATQGGFLGLAAYGPKEGSRIGAPAIEFEARRVTSVALLSPEAIEAWEKANVYMGE